MLIVEHRDADASEPGDQIRLRTVDDDEIGLERQDALEIGIDERADLRTRRDLGRVRVVARHADDLRAGADREQHLGDGGDRGR